MVVGQGQRHNIGEEPTVILYIYINRHAGKVHQNRGKSTPGYNSSHVVYWVTALGSGQSILELYEILLLIIGRCQQLLYDHIVSHQTKSRVTRKGTR